MQMTKTKIPYDTNTHRVASTATASNSATCGDPVRKLTTRFPSVDDVLAEIDTVCDMRGRVAA